MAEFTVATPAGIHLAVRRSGCPAGGTVVLLHGLTMSRDYVMMGSTALESHAYDVLAYDARGHGRTVCPGDTKYDYRDLADDVIVLLDAIAAGPVLLVGASMGCHTALRFALDHPDRVVGLVAITPAYEPGVTPTPDDIAAADEMARSLREGGREGFVSGLEAMSDPLAEVATIEFHRRRMSHHRDIGALADAVQGVVRSQPFSTLDELTAIVAPVLVIASRDRIDPRHPLALARRYAAALPRSRLIYEADGRAPLAWNRRALGRHVTAFADGLNWPAAAAPNAGPSRRLAVAGVRGEAADGCRNQTR